jgi:hypothetical protein
LLSPWLGRSWRAGGIGGVRYVPGRENKMKTVLTIVLIVLSSFITACTQLQSPYIIGEMIDCTNEDVDTETIWKVGETHYNIRVVSTNELIGTTFEWSRENKAYVPKTYDLVISELKDHLFLNIKGEDHYSVFYMAVACGGEYMVIYSLDEEEIKKHIPDGKVEYNKDDDVLLLKGSKEEIDIFILENIRDIFRHESPLIAELVTGEL